ncbi:capsular biosynthesis protein [Pacificimonas sp. WHA3]|uniref:Capsular biosynthesis protein n=1 Tax=Pacificimonas pallii TaxID=2827236 RepID=A0ABS6SB63_9SPHN|nr:capsular biosynthesis protein [Pacificimonas pallii]MBV7255166.1 capsular biosynthesis protein [Pacificimonas pallii]
MSGRRFLFLQGPQGAFFRRLGARLSAEGHRVLRINLNAGDRHDWPQGRSVRSRPERWPEEVAAIMAEQGTTDLVLYGDCRPDHRHAIEAARRRNAAIHVFEEGYFRPGFMTLEQGGVNGYSPLPRTPYALRARAVQLSAMPAAPDLPPSGREKSWGTFMYYARAHIGAAFRRYPYRGWHRGCAPLTEAAGYSRRWLRRKRDAHLTAQARAACAGKRYFVLPMQMDMDFTLRTHSPYGGMTAALAAILQDFAANAPADTYLIVKVHPHDNGRVDWLPQVKGARIFYSAGGDLSAMLAHAAGLVTVNSTSALEALQRGVPVKAMGTAIYDIAGLTHGGDLASFWQAPETPDAGLYRAFETVVKHDALVAGDHGSEAGLAILVEGSARKILAPARAFPGDERLSA